MHHGAQPDADLLDRHADRDHRLRIDLGRDRGHQALNGSPNTPTAPAGGRPRPTTEPDFGPTLPQLVRGWLPRLARWQRIALAIAGVAFAVGLGAIVFKAETANRNYTQTLTDARARGLEPIEFNFDYSRKLRISKPRRAYVQAQRTSNGMPVARFVVRPIRIEPQSGLASGYLPIAALELEKQAARTYPRFRLQFEGAARINEAAGYQFAFNAQLREPGKTPRQLLGREVIMPEPYDKNDPGRAYPPGQAPKRGVVISMFATTLDQVATARQIGDTGTLKKPFRSFRFGS